MFATGGVFGGEEGEAVGELSQRSAETVVLVVILRLLDHVSSNDCLVAMTIVRLVCDKVCLSQELLLVMLEFSDHDEGISSIATVLKAQSRCTQPIFPSCRRDRKSVV